MSRFPHRLLLALIAALAVLGVCAYAVLAASSSASFTLSPSPASQTISGGSNTSYAVTMTPVNGFSGQVTLSVASGLPAGTTASFSPNPVSPNTKSCNTCQSSTLNLSTTSSTPGGNYTLTIKGVSGSLVSTTAVTLVVSTSSPSTSFGLSASPSSATLAAGSTAAYTVSLARTNFTSNVGLSVTSGLPTGAVASFSPNPLVGPSGASSTLTVTTSGSTTPDGTYTLEIDGTGGSPSQTHTATVTLVVSTPSGSGFSISGNLQGTLYPGITLPLNPSLTNPNNFDLSITNLTVAVTSVTKAAGAPAGTCSPSDFTVQQFSGPYPFKLNSGVTQSLQDLTFPQAQWPQITMINQPYSQDACKGATVNLGYSGTASKAAT